MPSPHPHRRAPCDRSLPSLRASLVRNRFDGGWGDGFEVAEAIVFDEDRPPRYRLLRLSDGTVLPAQFGEDELSAIH